MAAKIKIHTPATFSAIMQVIEAYQEAHEVSWYRGCGKASHQLSPSLFRHPKHRSAENLHVLEKSLASTFAQRSPPFIQQGFQDEWERMFFMQHYGIPTRLLDWTESPFVALYFALTNCTRNRSNKPSEDIAVWLLDPSEWNKSALKDISFQGGVLDSQKEQVKSYSPNAELEERKNLPIMIHGTHNSARIVAQRGMFALFGKSITSMDANFESGGFTSGTLEKIVIGKENVDKIASSLFRKGISDSTVYPDLFGLSLELRRSFGF